MRRVGKETIIELSGIVAIEDYLKFELVVSLYNSSFPFLIATDL
jgi:hypothetical protein